MAEEKWSVALAANTITDFVLFRQILFCSHFAISPISNTGRELFWGFSGLSGARIKTDLKFEKLKI
jgi:hypothetical protein